MRSLPSRCGSPHRCSLRWQAEWEAACRAMVRYRRPLTWRPCHQPPSAVAAAWLLLAVGQRLAAVAVRPVAARTAPQAHRAVTAAAATEPQRAADGGGAAGTTSPAEACDPPGW
eukprot:2493931-Prymnesium_polylepis.2